MQKLWWIWTGTSWLRVLRLLSSLQVWREALPAVNWTSNKWRDSFHGWIHHWEVGMFGLMTSGAAPHTCWDWTKPNSQQPKLPRDQAVLETLRRGISLYLHQERLQNRWWKRDRALWWNVVDIDQEDNHTEKGTLSDYPRFVAKREVWLLKLEATSTLASKTASSKDFYPRKGNFPPSQSPSSCLHCHMLWWCQGKSRGKLSFKRGDCWMVVGGKQVHSYQIGVESVQCACSWDT